MIKKILYGGISLIASLLLLLLILIFIQNKRFDGYEVTSYDKHAQDECHSEHIDFATYNVWLTPWVAVDIDERLEKIVTDSSIQSLEVLCTQELFDIASIDTLKSRLSQSLPYSAVPKDTRVPLVSWLHSGLAVFSKFPITSCDWMTWKETNLVEINTAKGMLHVTLDINGNDVEVYNVHLIAVTKYGEYNEERRKQIDTLIAKIKDVGNKNFILAGDLNTDDLWQLKDLVDLSEAMVSPPTIHHYDNPYADKKVGLVRQVAVDFVLLGCESIFTPLEYRVEQNFFSDHLSVTKTIEI